ncbi:Acylphosphatase-like domain-containing protein [Usnea florida]
MHRLFSITAYNMSQQRISYTVHGRVQGVNFRSFTQTKAKSLNLTGFVMNTSDDKVSGEAQGSEDSIKSFLKELNSGPSAAHVTKVEKEEITTKEGESSFGTR